MKQINDFKGYFITKDGRIFSKKRNRFLKTHITKYGYVRVGLSNRGIVHAKLVHRLLAEAFIPNTNNKTDVNHINGIKDDNRLENLEWATRSENVKHAFDNGLNKVSEKARRLSSERAKKYVGKNSPQARRVASYKDGVMIKCYDTLTEAAIDNNCGITSISNCLTGRSKTCKGLNWKYYE